MRNHYFLAAALAMPLTAIAQKDFTPLTPVYQQIAGTKTPIYRALKDSARAAPFTLSAPERVLLIGKVNNRWSVIKRSGFPYYISTNNLASEKSAYSSPTSDRLEKLQDQLALERATNAVKLAALDTKNGFRNYRFGDDISQYPELHLDLTDRNTKQYSYPKENLKIGEATLTGITYFFYKDKLSSILIQTPNISESRRVLAALQEQYGRGFKKNNLLEEYLWGGDKVTMAYDENSITRSATVYISSRTISTQQQADEKEAAKKAASDL